MTEPDETGTGETSAATTSAATTGSAPQAEVTSRPLGVRRSQPPTLTAVQKFGPLALVMALLAGVGVYLVAFDPKPVAAPTAQSAGPDRGPESIDEVRVLPPGVETYARAKLRGTADDIDWGDRCDLETGKLKIPLWPQADCFQPFEGDNGGATEQGITADVIKVVLYQSQPNDPVLGFINAQIDNNETNEQVLETNRGFVELFNRYYELYGRRVEIIPYVATGAISDSTAATADAETIARDVAPFAVIGGPRLSTAFADTLARNKVLCISCSPGQPAEWYDTRSPYVWDVLKNADQAQQQTAEYLGKRLWGRKAIYAGDESMHSKERVFGFVHTVGTDSAKELEDRLLAQLRDDYDMEFEVNQTYSLPTELAGTGKDMITRMKEAGVTTVYFSGDPLAPQTLTRIATEQDYFPEWVIGPSVLVDTAIFSRTYDQRQWAHAFGPTNLFARSNPDVVGTAFLYQWYYGKPPPARTSIALITGPLQVLYGAFQGAGPGLTHELFKQVLFGSPIIPSSPISAQVSFGDRGVFPDPDYAGLDDQTEVWWDSEAVGPAENGKVAKGLWRYVDGGKRYLPGEWPEGQPKLFDPAGTVTIYEESPPGTELPDYEPLR